MPTAADYLMALTVWSSFGDELRPLKPFEVFALAVECAEDRLACELFESLGWKSSTEE